MAEILKTIRVKFKGTEREVVINETDFNNEQYEHIKGSTDEKAMKASEKAKAAEEAEKAKAAEEAEKAKAAEDEKKAGKTIKELIG